MQPVKKKQYFFSVLFSLFWAGVAFAQSPLPEAAGVANLTVTVTLDKPIDEKVVAQYRQLAQELVRNLPAEINQPADLRMLSENPAYKNMQVVAYFPVINGKADTQIAIKNYRLRFVHTDAKQPDPSPPVVVAREGYLSVTPAMGVAIRLQKPDTPEQKAEKILAETAAPLQPVAQPVAKVETVAAKALPKPTPLVIRFVADSTLLTEAERKQISELAANLRQRKDIHAFSAVVATYPGPSGDRMRLGDERLQRIIALLRQLDVDVSRTSMTEIHIHTRRQQFVRFEVELKK